MDKKLSRGLAIHLTLQTANDNTTAKTSKTTVIQCVAWKQTQTAKQTSMTSALKQVCKQQSS
jgi:hypothetical protein